MYHSQQEGPLLSDRSLPSSVTTVIGIRAVDLLSFMRRYTLALPPTVNGDSGIACEVLLVGIGKKNYPC